MMAWQCMKCLHHIPNGVSHSCINDELRDLQKQYAEALKMLEEMAGALELYAATNDSFPEYGTVARETLEKYRQFKNDQ